MTSPSRVDTARRRLLVFETHPIQYRAPIYQAMEKLAPGSFEVVYASDFSVRGYRDKEFGSSLSWDVPLLAGYPHRVLGNEAARLAEHWSGLTARGVDRLVDDARPDAVLLSSMSYAFNWAAYWAALRRGIPIWIRMETQDEAYTRGPFKRFVRSLVYRAVYRGVSKAFYIGELSREHLRRHGVPPQRLVPARYCTPDPLASMSVAEKAALRAEMRASLGFDDDHVVVAFFGKLISKKDPLIVPRALAALPASAGRKFGLLVVGSGELEAPMRELGAGLERSHGARSVFTGFINQSKLSSYYLASDIVVLPSQRMGETWGLVINEALQAGCSAVVSNAVGCHRDLGAWPRVLVFPVDDTLALGRAIEELAALPRELCWAQERLAEFSIGAAARSIVRELATVPPRGGGRA